MKNMIPLLVCVAVSVTLFSQSNIQQSLSINSDGAAPAASALLDVQATDKGILIPRMTLAQRNAIASPATGLLVYEIPTPPLFLGGSFWFYNGSAWQQINSGNPSTTSIADTDGDTKIQTEESPNENIIRFDLGDTEKMVLRKNTSGAARLELPDAANSTIIGHEAGVNNQPVAGTSGENNTFIGYRSGNANTTGNNNSAMGASSLFSNTSGSLNTANGINALYNNTTGNKNTAFGSFALTSSTTASYNTAFGSSALLNTTTGDLNTAVGHEAMMVNTTGDQNTAVGEWALRDNTDGYRNTAIGIYALASNTTGHDNTAIGGFQAMPFNTTGYDNVAVGAYCLNGNTTGIRNTSAGFQTLLANSIGNENTANGYHSLYFNTTGSGNTALGFDVAHYNSTGNNNTAVGYFALADNQTGSWNTAVGEFTNVSSAASNSRTMLGTRAYSECDNCVVIGSVAGKNGSAVTANIGIGTSNPTHTLEVGVNDAAKPGSSTWTITSDQRLKENIKPYSDGLASVLAIRPVTFHYNENSGFDTAPEYVGIVAQELQTVAPYMVSENERTLKDGSTGNYLTVDNGAMTYLLINAVKELAAENAALQAELRTSKVLLEGERLLNETQSAQLDKITTALAGAGIVVEK